MGKVQNNQKGFSAIEAILIFVIVGVVGGVGWYVYNSNKQTNKTLDAATQTSNSASPKFSKLQNTSKPVAGTVTYTDASKAYTVAYPATWTIKEQPLNGLDRSAPLDTTEAIFTPSNLPTGAAGQTWVGISSFKGDMNTVFKQAAFASSESYNPQKKVINGNQALYHQEVVPATKGVNGAAGGAGFTDYFYAVTHNNVVLVFYFREKQDGNGIASSFDATSLVPSYTMLVKSVKFLN